jgi:hypothetical protein
MKTATRICLSSAVVGLFFFAMAQVPTYGDSYSVTINTLALEANPLQPLEIGAILADANATPDGNNTVALTGFSFAGGSAAPLSTQLIDTSGGSSASGNLFSGITLTDTDPSGLNYIVDAFTPGSTLSFGFSMTTNQDLNVDTTRGIPGDQFTFVLFDSTGDPIVTTDPVVGEDAFLVATICTPGQTFSGQVCPTDSLLVQSYGLPGAAATTVVSNTAVPEPATLLLLCAGILALAILALGARRRCLAF